MLPTDAHLVLEPSAEAMTLVAAGVIPPDARVLVFGAYRGDDAVYFATAGCSVVAVDISSAATAYGRALAAVFEVHNARAQRVRVAGAAFRTGDVDALKTLASGSFDVVWDRLVLSNLSRGKARTFVKEAARLLRERGLLYTATGFWAEQPLSAARESLPRGLELKRWFRPARCGSDGRVDRVARPVVMPLYPSRNADFANTAVCCLLERKQRR